jgi:hypothetical protein
VDAESVKRDLHEWLLDLFLMRVHSSPGWSDADVKNYLDSGRKSRMHTKEFKDNVPDNFYAMMNALEQLGEEMPLEVEYDYCVKCYTVFRKELKDLDTCPCGHCRWKDAAAGKRTANGTFKYR